MFSLIIHLFGVLQAFAAPIPATTSSSLIAAKPGIFYSPIGFSLNAGKTGWIQTAPPMDNPYIVTMYREPYRDQAVQGALTVRVDQERTVTTIDAFSKKWLKDYPRLGFEVLSAKKIKLSGQMGYLIDLISRDNQIQLRQVLFLKGRNAVNLTCRDHQKDFAETLQKCNEIIRSFNW